MKNFRKLFVLTAAILSCVAIVTGDSKAATFSSSSSSSSRAGPDLSTFDIGRILSANYGSPAQDEFHRWLDHFPHETVGSTTGYAKEPVIAGFRELIQFRFPAGKSGRLCADLLRIVSRALGAAKPCFSTTSTGLSYIAPHPIRRTMLTIDDISCQILFYTSGGQVPQYVGDFPISEDGTINSSQLFRTGPSGFVPASIEDIAKMSVPVQVRGFDLEAILAASYDLKDGFDSQFEGWIYTIPHVGEDSINYELESSMVALGELAETIVPHAGSTALLSDVMARIKEILSAVQPSVVTGRSYIGYEPIQAAVLLLRKIRGQVQSFVPKIHTVPLYVASFRLGESDSIIGGAIGVTTGGVDGIQATDDPRIEVVAKLSSVLATIRGLAAPVSTGPATLAATAAALGVAASPSQIAQATNGWNKCRDEAAKRFELLIQELTAQMSSSASTSTSSSSSSSSGSSLK